MRRESTRHTMTPIETAIKRGGDIVVALLCLLLAAPLMGLIAALIRLESPGPALYTPVMLGKGGKAFRLYRFRTMTVEGAREPGAAPTFTRVGRVIRELSLDHLPTLLNVLKGDLSLVGPRPMEPEFVNPEDPTWQRYFGVRPGLCSYAILKLGRTFGHSDAGNLPLKQALELEYIEKQSLKGDLRLLLRCIGAQVASGGNVKARGKPDPAIVPEEKP